ncbi:MAG: hypothetical protein KGQ36_04430 [Rickettsiales bacterium]|nr:hypothetical protein [Rickettsiales bacterium]
MIVGIIIAGVTQFSLTVTASRLSVAKTLTQSSPIAGIKDLAVWFESTSDKSFDLTDQVDGANVDNWYDLNPQSVSKINLAQATSNLQPLFKESGINDLPALQFDGDSTTGDYLTTSSFKFQDFTKKDETTFFLVIKLAVPNNNSPFMIHDTLGAGDYRINFHAPESGYLRFDYGYCCVEGTGRVSVTTPSDFSAKQKVITLVRRPTTGIIRVNKSDVTNVAMTSTFSDSTLNSTAYFDIGRISYDSTYSFNEYIGEFVIFRRALKTEEIVSVEEYLMKKWGI